MIALGCGVVASVAVSQVVLDQKGRAVQTTGILVVSKNISAAAKISPDSVRLEQYPVDKIPMGAISDIKLIEGKFAKQPIYANEPLLDVKLSNKGKELIIPDGYRVFDIVVSDHMGGSGYIGPGDRVDVFGFFEKGRINSSKSVKVMENLEVLMVDGVASIDPEAPATAKRSSTIQLLVKDKQYSVLDTATNLGKLRLALRPPQRDEAASGLLDDGEKFMSWLRETEAVKTPERMVSAPALPATQIPTAVVEHEMIVVTPESSNVFRWKKGDSMPTKFDSSKGAESEMADEVPAGGIQSGYNPIPYSTPPKPNGSGTAAVPPNASASSNMKWDPNSGTWQVGGFKAAYPMSK